jgi:hypothetical protein
LRGFQNSRHYCNRIGQSQLTAQNAHNSFARGSSYRVGQDIETVRPRPRKQQVSTHSLSFISAGLLLQDSTLLAQKDSDFWITFKDRERGVWRTAQSLLVNSSDPSEVKRKAVKYMRKKEQMRLYDTDLNILTHKCVSKLRSLIKAICYFWFWRGTSISVKS